MSSTSQIYRIFEELRKRQYSEVDELKEWAFQNSENIYIPFGSGGRIRQKATSAKDYYRLCDEHARSIGRKKNNQLGV